jgi:hypothetical protein
MAQFVKNIFHVPPCAENPRVKSTGVAWTGTTDTKGRGNYGLEGW